MCNALIITGIDRASRLEAPLLQYWRRLTLTKICHKPFNSKSAIIGRGRQRRPGGRRQLQYDNEYLHVGEWRSIINHVSQSRVRACVVDRTLTSRHVKRSVAILAGVAG